MKIEVLKEFIKKTVQQEVRNVIQSEIKLQLAEIFSKEAVQTKKKSADSDLDNKFSKNWKLWKNHPLLKKKLNQLKSL